MTWGTFGDLTNTMGRGADPVGTTFHNGMLNLPGLMPVNIGSSSPYAVPYAPQIKPPAGTPFPQQAASAPALSPPSGSGPEANGSFAPSYSEGGQVNNTPWLSGLSDFPTFGDSYGFGSLGGGGGGLGAGNGDWTSFDPLGFGSGASSTQTGGSSGNSGSDLGLGSLGDRISALGNSPHITGGNIGQAAINAAGIVSPIPGALAGILQGFNLYDAPKSTGNPAVDLLATPGVMQSSIADMANWLNRQFGGTYMPYDDPVPTYDHSALDALGGGGGAASDTSGLGQFQNFPQYGGSNPSDPFGSIWADNYNSIAYNPFGGSWGNTDFSNDLVYSPNGL